MTDSTRIRSIERKLKNQPSEKWQKSGQFKALGLFKEMADRVPAYKDFLSKNKIDATKINSSEDFKNIPLINKENYLKMYPLNSLCWDGDMRNSKWTISTTSGSTGTPFYFPRTGEQDNVYADIAELYLRNNFQIQNHSTLYINGFAMGAWIGGVFTYEAIKILSERGYRISIISPGIFKYEILKAIQNLALHFDQIIIGGYPPFVKDMIDEGTALGINWKSYKMGFVFSAEGFSEKFRDYIIHKTHLEDPYKSTLNHYGSVDLGTMAHETPLCIYIRKRLLSSPRWYRDFFNHQFQLPTLTQYNPEHYFFEEVNEQLICSSRSGIPLVRYDLKDRGGTYSHDQVCKKFSQYGIDLENEIKRKEPGIYMWKIPFVYVYERSDFIIKLYGANIYPETIRKALLNHLITKFVTGKFNAQIFFDKYHNQKLKINIELRKNTKESQSLCDSVEEIIVKTLLRDNSEYRSNFKESPKKQKPKIILFEYESPDYFKPGIKQKWTNK